MAERTVNCKKLGKELPGLEKPPFPGKIGEAIFENISREAWGLWRDDMQMKVLNEYRLNMGDPDDYKVLQQQMMLFLNLEEGQVVEVENEQRGKEG